MKRVTLIQGLAKINLAALIVVIATIFAGCGGDKEVGQESREVHPKDEVSYFLTNLEKLGQDPEGSKDYLEIVDRLAVFVKDEAAKNPEWMKSFLQDIVELAVTLDVRSALTVRFYADDRLLKESEHLHQQIEEKEKIIAGQQEEVAKLSQQLVDGQQENVSLRQQLEQLTQRIEGEVQLKQQLAETQKKVAAQQQEVSSLKERGVLATSLEAEVQKLRMALQDREQQISQLKGNERRISELEGRILLLQDLLRNPDLRPTGLEKYNKAFAYLQQALKEIHQAVTMPEAESLVDGQATFDVAKMRRRFESARDQVELGLKLCPSDEILRTLMQALTEIIQDLNNL